MLDMSIGDTIFFGVPVLFFLVMGAIMAWSDHKSRYDGRIDHAPQELTDLQKDMMKWNVNDPHDWP